MITDFPDINAECLEREIAWFRSLLNDRLEGHARGGGAGDLLGRHRPPDLPTEHSPYADVVNQFRLDPSERLVLVLALLPHIRPDVLDPLLIQNDALQR